MALNIFLKRVLVLKLTIQRESKRIQESAKPKCVQVCSITVQYAI